MSGVPLSSPRIVSTDPQADFRTAIREKLAEACEELKIPDLYRPGVINSTDLALAIFILAVYERHNLLTLAVKSLKGVVLKEAGADVVVVKKDPAKKSTAMSIKAAAAAARAQKKKAAKKKSPTIAL